MRNAYFRGAARFAGAALTTAALLSGGPAAAQLSNFNPFSGDTKGSPDLWKACEGQDGVAPDKQI